MAGVILRVDLSEAQEAIRRSNGGEPRKLTPSELQTLRDGQGRILNAFTETWPVKTGLSKAGWRVKITTRGGLGYSVYNDVYYSEWVFRAGEGPDPLFPKLFDYVESSIVPDISDTLIEYANIIAAEFEADKAYENEIDTLLDEYKKEQRDILKKAKGRGLIALTRSHGATAAGVAVAASRALQRRRADGTRRRRA